jgi:hypothetical protein
MQCIGCGSTAVSERNERTAQGYRRLCGTTGRRRAASGRLLRRRLWRTWLEGQAGRQRGICTTGLVELRLRYPGVAQVGASQVGARQIRPAQVGSAQVGTNQTGVA